MNALEALGDDRANAKNMVPFAAQSRDEPVPYSVPAMMTSGTPRRGTRIAAS